MANRYWVGVEDTDTYYFDGSDAAASDPDSNWTNETNADDGSTSTQAYNSQADGSATSNELKIEGTNAPASGDSITQVRARIYGHHEWFGETNAAVYTNGLGQLLGTPFVDVAAAAWGSYVTLSTPTGGWTWAKLQALEVAVYTTNTGSSPAGGVRKVEIEVTSADYDGNWSDTSPTNWSLTSGGTGNVAVPTSSDDVYFDGNSGDGTCTLTASASAKTLTTTAYGGDISHNSTYRLIIYGTGTENVVLGSDVDLILRPDDAETLDITSNGYTITALDMGSETDDVNLEINDNLTCTDYFELQYGTVTLNGHTLTAEGGGSINSYLSADNTAGKLVIKNHELYITDYDNSLPNLDVEVQANTANAGIEFQDTSAYYLGDLKFSSLSTYNTYIQCNSDIDVDSVEITAGSKMVFENSHTYTADSWTMTGTATSFITIESDSAGNDYTLDANTATVNASYVSYKDSTVTDGTWNVFNGVDVSGNTGWNESGTRYWVGGTGDWDETSNWAYSSGGGGGASIPTTSDDVYIDSNSGFGSGGTLSWVGGYPNVSCKDFTSNTGHTYTINSNAVSSGIRAFGDVVLEAGLTMESGTHQPSIAFWDTLTFDQNGADLSDTNLTLDTNNTDVTLLDDVSCNKLTLYNESNLDANNFDITIAEYFAFYDDPTITMGSGTWTGSGWYASSSTLAVTAETSTIVINGTSNFSDDNDNTYNNLWLQDESDIYYSATFNDLKIDDDLIIEFGGGETITVSSFTALGTESQGIGLQSTTSSPFYLSKSSGIVECDWLYITDSYATGGADWYAGDNSSNEGGNTGWIFTDVPVFATADATMTFATETPSLGTVDSYPASEGTINTNLNHVITAMGQSFTGDGTTLDSVQFDIKKGNSPTGNATAKIYAHTGTFGSGGMPTGAALATSDSLDVSTLTTSYALTTFDFTGVDRIALADGTNYVVILDYPDGLDYTNVVKVNSDNVSPTHAGNQSVYYSASWHSTTQDTVFYVTGEDSGRADLIQTFSASADTTMEFNKPAYMDFYDSSSTGVTLYSGGFTELGNTFTGDGGDVSKVGFSIRQLNTAPGNVTAKLYAHTGTWGSSGQPGTLLATSDTITASTLSTSFSIVDFTFSTPYTTTDGTHYCIVVAYSSGDGSNGVVVEYDGSTGANHPGNMIYYNGSWFTASSLEGEFYVYGAGYSADLDLIPGSSTASTTMTFGSSSADALVTKLATADDGFTYATGDITGGVYKFATASDSFTYSESGDVLRTTLPTASVTFTYDIDSATIKNLTSTSASATMTYGESGDMFMHGYATADVEMTYDSSATGLAEIFIDGSDSFTYDQSGDILRTLIGSGSDNFLFSESGDILRTVLPTASTDITYGESGDMLLDVKVSGSDGVVFISESSSIALLLGAVASTTMTFGATVSAYTQTFAGSANLFTFSETADLSQDAKITASDTITYGYEVAFGFLLDGGSGSTAFAWSTTGRAVYGYHESSSTFGGEYIIAPTNASGELESVDSTSTGEFTRID